MAKTPRFPVPRRPVAALRLVALLLAALLPCACSGDDGVLRIQLNWVAEPEFGGLFAAEQLGLFAAEGLEVELVQGGPGIPAAQLCAAGNVEFAVVAANQLLELNEKGGDLVALHAAFQGNPMGVMVHESSPYRSLQDLWMSETVIAFEEGLADFAWLTKAYPGGKRKIVPYSANLALFAADPSLASQCFFTSEPVSLELQGVKTRTFMISESGYDPYNVILVTKRAFWQARQRECKALVRAVAKGWRAYLDEPGPTQEVMTRMNRTMTRAAMDRAAEVQRPLVASAATKELGLGCMTAERWREIHAQLTDIGRLHMPLASTVVEMPFFWDPDAGTAR